MNETKPFGYESELSDFKPCLFDACSGEPVAWGFQIQKQLGDDRFSALRKLGELECCYSGYSPIWFLVVRRISRKEAIAKYGPITNEEYGPRGGWKSVTFGTTRFISKTFWKKKRK